MFAEKSRGSKTRSLMDIKKKSSRSLSASRPLTRLLRAHQRDLRILITKSLPLKPNTILINSTSSIESLSYKSNFWRKMKTRLRTELAPKI